MQGIEATEEESGKEPKDGSLVQSVVVAWRLLDALARKFTEYNYDFRKLVRDICLSRTYQLASTTNDTNASDDRNFAHAAVRRIRAEVLLDCISQATEAKEKFQGLPLGARAVQIADGRTANYFLTTFGRATRETVCSCEVKMEPNLSQALHLLNGETVQDIDLKNFDQTVLRHNGQPAPALKDRPLRGHIGFQELSRGDSHVLVKNARIKEL